MRLHVYVYAHNLVAKHADIQKKWQEAARWYIKQNMLPKFQAVEGFMLMQ
jgi:hypothetical protein